MASPTKVQPPTSLHVQEAQQQQGVSSASVASGAISPTTRRHSPRLNPGLSTSSESSQTQDAGSAGDVGVQPLATGTHLTPTTQPTPTGTSVHPPPTPTGTSMPTPTGTSMPTPTGTSMHTPTPTSGLPTPATPTSVQGLVTPARVDLSLSLSQEKATKETRMKKTRAATDKLVRRQMQSVLTTASKNDFSRVFALPVTELDAAGYKVFLPSLCFSFFSFLASTFIISILNILFYFDFKF